MDHSDSVRLLEVQSSLEALRRSLLGAVELTVDEIADRAEVEQQDVRAYWVAVGLRPPGSADRAFSQSDADAIDSVINGELGADLSHADGESLVRSLGFSTERMVAWQIEAIVERIMSRDALSDTRAREVLLERLPDYLPLLEHGLIHAWRRHLVAAAERVAADVQRRDDADNRDELPLVRAVGMADVVGFTTRTAELGAAALADYVQMFEGRARSVVTRLGGRVIKTVGDALLFTADDPETGARIALGLTEELDVSSDAPLRVGLVWGRVLSRLGDVFGPSVSLASRLCNQAGPGRVLVDEPTAALLPGFLTEPLGVRELAGIGQTRPVLLVAETARDEEPLTPG